MRILLIAVGSVMLLAGAAEAQGKRRGEDDPVRAACREEARKVHSGLKRLSWDDIRALRREYRKDCNAKRR